MIDDDIQDQVTGGGEDHLMAGGRRKRTKVQIGRLAALLVVLIALAATAFAAFAQVGPLHGARTRGAEPSTPTPTAAPTVTPDATATAGASQPPTTLYQADWSHAANLWALPAGVQIVNGQLVTDGTQAVDVPVPYVADVARYTIEMDIQVLSTQSGPDTNFITDVYGLVANDATGAELYALELRCEAGRTHCLGQDSLYVDHYQPNMRSAAFADHDFSSGGGVRNYALMVNGSTATFCTPRAQCIFSVTGSAPLSPAHLVLTLHNVQLVMTRFVITTP